MFIGIVLFFEENEVELDDLIVNSFYIGCFFLRYLFVIVYIKYKDFWFLFFLGKDVYMLIL